MSDFRETGVSQAAPSVGAKKGDATPKRFPDGGVIGVSSDSALVSQVSNAEEVASLTAMLAFICANDNLAPGSTLDGPDLQQSRRVYEQSCVELVQTLNALLHIFQRPYSCHGDR